MKRARKVLCIVLSLVLVLTGIALEARQAEAATPVASNGRLKVKGMNIVNKKGKPFVIKGVSTHGLAWYPQYVNKETFASLKSRGVNTVRLAMYTEESGGYCISGGEKKRELKALIDKGVKVATELGMYVIIDWHILSDGNPMKNKSQAKDFFAEIAKKYSSHNNVLYEICNEPNGTDGTWKNIRKYAKDVIKTIRKYDKNAIIIVGTPTWSQEVDVAAKNPLTGQKNIVYALHFYASTHGDWLMDRVKTAAKKKLPMLVSEFGISEASGNGRVSTAAGDKWMRLLNKYKIGRVCWNLSNKNENSALLKSSCKRTSGFQSGDFTKQGKWLWKQYKK